MWIPSVLCACVCMCVSVLKPTVSRLMENGDKTYTRQIGFRTPDLELCGLCIYSPPEDAFTRSFGQMWQMYATGAPMYKQSGPESLYSQAEFVITP